jgi:hypothetical protein
MKQELRDPLRGSPFSYLSGCKLADLVNLDLSTLNTPFNHPDSPPTHTSICAFKLHVHPFPNSPRKHSKTFISSQSIHPQPKTIQCFASEKHKQTFIPLQTSHPSQHFNFLSKNSANLPRCPINPKSYFPKSFSHV